MSQQIAQIILAVNQSGHNLEQLSVSTQFPIKAVIRKAKCLQIEGFLGFISSYYRTNRALTQTC